MAKKKKKGTLDQVLDIASDLSGAASGVVRIIPDATEVYNIGKDITSNSFNAFDASGKKDKIRKLIVEIGDRICSKNIEVKDRNVMAEVECINELQVKIDELNANKSK